MTAPAKTPDKTYRYTGPRSSATLAGGREVILVPGTEVELPACSYTAALEARGHLVAIETAQAAATPPAPSTPAAKGGKHSAAPTPALNESKETD